LVNRNPRTTLIIGIRVHRRSGERAGRKMGAGKEGKERGEKEERKDM